MPGKGDTSRSLSMPAADRLVALRKALDGAFQPLGALGPAQDIAHGGLTWLDGETTATRLLVGEPGEISGGRFSATARLTGAARGDRAGRIDFFTIGKDQLHWVFRTSAPMERLKPAAAFAGLDQPKHHLLAAFELTQVACWHSSLDFTLACRAATGSERARLEDIGRIAPDATLLGAGLSFQGEADFTGFLKELQIDRLLAFLEETGETALSDRLKSLTDLPPV